ncbi:MMPL family transporter [Geopsychrobacter electrodiphilus]|uniref:MMPL family transporter n=1 Tax=Geopsychrobacter electrodiphilus TaxID=225196 RepID=UPI00035D760A|nr:MMPL family transporter [Geopsychrobacter electrodiphilus]
MKLIASCYILMRERRGWLVLILLLLVLASGWNLAHLKIEESIVSMLPDGDSRVADDFHLLQQAPFARKLVIHLRAAPGVAVSDLMKATDQLRDSLPPDLFIHPVSGPGELGSSPLLRELGDFLPLLADAQDLQKIDQQLQPEQIDRSIAEDLAQLLQPQGVALKQQIQRDPLNLQRLALAKLGYVNPLPGVRLVEGHFLSADGRSSLILADTPVLITDAAGARELLETFRQARQQLPVGISAALISGHGYTLANADAIKNDMRLVLLVSGLGILVLFLVFLRSWRALAVYLLPLFSMALALLVASVCYGRLSGITVGFGAVLLGITIDFGLHVYFALRYGQGEPAELLRAVARPVIFGALTTLAAFAALLRSELPGQRQLAIFAIAGILAALLLALLFLPHFIVARGPVNPLSRKAYRRHIYLRKPWLRWAVLSLWLGLCCLGALQARHLSINGELRQLSYLPTALQQNEQQLAKVWGNMRGRALAFAEAPDLETALQLNERLWQLLGEKGLQTESVSLAPLFPSARTQQQHLQNWESFWQERRLPTEALVQKAGAHYGFAGDAFAPFFARLAQPQAVLDVPTLQRWGLGGLLENLLLQDERGYYQVLTLIPDRPELISSLDSELSALPGLTLVSQTRFGRQLSQEISSDFKHFILLAGLAVLLLLLLLFRRLPEVLLALLPVMTGLLAMFGGMGWLGLEMNLFNVAAAILIIGLGVDYGIFMVCHSQQPEDLASSRAVLVSGLTTLAGFGALVLAKHPALHSIGLTVLLGISAAVPTAVLVIPALRVKRN